MTNSTITTAKIYVGTYAKYNSGSINGAWLDLGDYSSAEEFLTSCADLHADEENPEFMFQDYEGFPARFYGESMSESDLDKLFAALPLIAALEDADDSTLVQLHNTACDVLNHPDDQIYDFDEEFFNMAFGDDCMKAARAASFGDLNWSDDYIRFNGYANLESVSNVRNEIDEDLIFEAFESSPNDFDL